jgi:hypothetical protein
VTAAGVIVGSGHGALDSGRALIFPAQNLPLFFIAQNIIRDVPCIYDR